LIFSYIKLLIVYS